MSNEEPQVNPEDAEQKLAQFRFVADELNVFKRDLEASLTRKRAELKEETKKQKQDQDESKIKGLQNEMLKITEMLNLLKRTADARGLGLRYGETASSLTRYLSYAGFAFIVVSIGLLIFSAIVLNKLDETPKLPEGATTTAIVVAYITIYFKPILIIVSGLIASGIGYSLFRAAGTASKQVLPEKDYELLREMLITNNQDGIINYIKLSSLTGIVGTFTKVGLSGLPLATIGLTFLFAVLAMIGKDPLDKQLFDLAKLTLGAFIGSYVQREVTERKATQK